MLIKACFGGTVMNEWRLNEWISVDDLLFADGVSLNREAFQPNGPTSCWTEHADMQHLQLINMKT